MVRTALSASIVVLIVLLSGCTRTDRAETAWNFKLQDLDGKNVSLSDFKGKPVLIDFWASWCPPCRESIPGIQNLHKNYGARGLVVLGISMDQGGWDSVKTFTTEYGMTYPVLKGDDQVLTEYQVRTIPLVVLVNKDGRIVKRLLGFGGEGELEKDIEALL